MGLPAKQNLLDWITQCWNIGLGKRVNLENDSWLIDPIGEIGETNDQYLERISLNEKLIVKKNEIGFGLIESFEYWPSRTNNQIKEFYRNTLAFEMSCQTSWKPGFATFGYLISMLFSRRLQQLNLPESTSESSLGIESEIIKLTDDEDKTKYTIWHRYLRDSKATVFFGIYSNCRLPSGECCVKASFPLPQGSASVIFRIENDESGNLNLISSGTKYGDPGFYFIVKDSSGFLWKHYLPNFSEKISFSHVEDGILHAEHKLKLWSFRVYDISYDIKARKT